MTKLFLTALFACAMATLTVAASHVPTPVAAASTAVMGAAART